MEEARCKKEINSGNNRSPKWELPHTPPNNTANQQLEMSWLS